MPQNMPVTVKWIMGAASNVLYGLAGQSRKIAYQLGFFGIQLLQRYRREAAYRNPLVPHQTPHTLYTLHNKVRLSPFSCIPVLIFSFPSDVRDGHG
jgi:hypothetical protein